MFQKPGIDIVRSNFELPLMCFNSRSLGRGYYENEILRFCDWQRVDWKKGCQSLNDDMALQAMSWNLY